MFIWHSVSGAFNESEMKVLSDNVGIINSCVIVMYLQCMGAQLVADCFYRVCVQLYHSLFRITGSISVIHFSKLYHCSLTSVFITVILYCLSLISVLRKYYIIIQLYMLTPTQVIEI